MRKQATPRKVQHTETPVAEIPAEEVQDREAPRRMIRCVVCSGETQAESLEQMCWVCRRLKISAWREIEQQLPVQE